MMATMKIYSRSPVICTQAVVYHSKIHLSMINLHKILCGCKKMMLLILPSPLRLASPVRISSSEVATHPLDGVEYDNLRLLVLRSASETLLHSALLGPVVGMRSIAC